MKLCRITHAWRIRTHTHIHIHYLHRCMYKQDKTQSPAALNWGIPRGPFVPKSGILTQAMIVIPSKDTRTFCYVGTWHPFGLWGCEVEASPSHECHGPQCTCSSIAVAAEKVTTAASSPLTTADPVAAGPVPCCLVANVDESFEGSASH